MVLIVSVDCGGFSNAQMRLYVSMIILRRVVLLLAVVPFFLMAMAAQAQTSATLNVTARVVEQCEISAAEKRRAARILRKTGRRIDISQRCSKGVVSRVDERPVSRTIFLPDVPQPRRISKRRVVKRTAAGRDEVFLVTVTY